MRDELCGILHRHSGVSTLGKSELQLLRDLEALIEELEGYVTTLDKLLAKRDESVKKLLSRVRELEALVAAGVGDAR